ncbi:MAG TPA: hypothetical protein VMD09_14470 [Solirubrobacteraceae bacterium]|nr:hypothetical protein [Solirubrobacteraceae bacterium]
MAGPKTRSGCALIAGLAALALGAAPASAQLPPLPIPTVNVPPAPTYIGNPATPQPVTGIPATPQNPFMAPNGESEIHDDGWQTDVNWWGGPLGKEPQQVSSLLSRDCGSITFDRAGRVLSVCVGVSGPELYMFDPNTLETLATYMLPTRQHPPSNLFQDFTGGGYFYLDNQDRVVAATTTHHIYVIAETPGAPGFTLVHDYSLASVLTSSEDITSALPDSNGLLWFVTKTDGVVGTLNLSTGAIHTVHLGNGSEGEIENSFATDESGGVYIATNRKLYRFGAGAGGAPKIVWQVTYPNSGEHKPGQVDDGTGTTPTVMPGGYVNITDNADPMDIMVYRTAAHPKLPRQVCQVPIFSKGASADENSLITAGRIMIAENNYGYTDPTSVEGKTTTPGFVRVDLNANGNGCHTVWTNTTESAPTVVSKLALANGLVYTYTTDASGDWYWTALSSRTGDVVYKVLAGTGIGYNNNYAGISISPSGTEYLGTLGGIIALRDGVATPQPPPAAASATRTRVRRHRRRRISRRPHRSVGFTG